MQNIFCPFIGRLDDRETRFDFPSEAHACYKANPPGLVKLAHQQAYCLSAGHAACPVFQAAQAGRLPKAIAAPAPARPRAAFPARALIFGLAALALVAAGALALRGAMRPTQPLIPETGGEYTFLETPGSGSALVEGLPEQTAPADAPAALPACAPPTGWSAYVVLPTDSLAWLSGLYNISLADLRAANCLAADELVRAGDQIYVPALPTATDLPAATSTPTETPTVRVVARQIVVPSPTVTPQPPAEEPAPVETPPTAAPTDPPPPTEAPSPAATPTTQPLPTDTSLPPVEPTVGVSPTPNNGLIEISDSNQTQTIQCNATAVTVGGNNNSLTLIGFCLSLTVTGNNNDITLESPTIVVDLGNHNNIH